MKMKLILGVVSGLLLAARLAGAQSADDVQLNVGPYELAANGAEKPMGGWRGTGQLVIGTPVVGVFSMSGCGGFSITVPPHGFEKDATAGWRVEITPLKVVDHAVTFRLRWIRALDTSSGLTPQNEDIEVTLKPGESRPLDTVPVPPGAKTNDGRPCTRKAVSLRVVADFPDFDRRLIGANVWLVERLPNGKEQSQLQSLRGVPNRPISFYFDGVADEAGRFDIFGKLVADPEQGGIEFVVETIRARADPGQDGYQSTRWFKSTVHVKPNEIVDVALPAPVPTSGEKAGAFAKRVFSIRIQAKQIR
jgi:hypothetical protein